MFKNAQIYRLPRPWVIDHVELQEALEPQAFTPCTSMDLMRNGWAPVGDQGIVYKVGRQLFLQLRTEKKLLPASVIKEAAAARCLELEEQQGFAPGRKQRLEVRERVADELLPRAFSVHSRTGVWIDPVNGWMVVDAASPARADEVVKLLLKAVDKMPLESFRVQRSPVAMMTQWVDDEDLVPRGFTVDMDATLRATGESKAVVQYKRHTLDAQDLGRHIAAGKQCVRLALTWEDKISFVLSEGLALSGIKLLDVLEDKTEERLDGELMLMAGELNGLFMALTEALGGEAVS